MSSKRQVVAAARSPAASVAALGASSPPAAGKSSEGRGEAAAPGDFGITETIWTSWYDLPEGRVEDYIAWLNADYIPMLLKRPGYSWVAHYRRIPNPHPEIARFASRMQVSPEEAAGLGAGSQYILMVGGSSLETFLPPPTYALDDSEPAEARSMLSLRQGLRRSVLRDIMRANGPAARSLRAPAAPGPRIQFGTWQFRPDMEGALWKWYLDFRFPQIRECPGAITARVLIGLEGWAKGGILYDFDSAEAHLHFLDRYEGPAVKLYADRPELPSPRQMLIQAPSSPGYADRIWPPLDRAAANRG